MANTASGRFVPVNASSHAGSPNVNLAVALLTTALVIVVALLAAAGAGKLARLDGATYPTALTRAATTFTAVLTLATTATTAYAALRT